MRCPQGESCACTRPSHCAFRHIDFVLPVAHDLLAGLAAWEAKAGRGCMDYGFHVAVTSWSDRVAADMATAVSRHGVNSFKFFMAYKGALMVNDAELLAGMRRCLALGALAMVHAENGEAVEDGRAAVFAAGVTGPEGHALSRPAAVEEEATGRAIRLAHLVDAPLYVVHVMAAGAAAQVAAVYRASGNVGLADRLAERLGLDDVMPAVEAAHASPLSDAPEAVQVEAVVEAARVEEAMEAAPHAAAEPDAGAEEASKRRREEEEAERLAMLAPQRRVRLA